MTRKLTVQQFEVVLEERSTALMESDGLTREEAEDAVRLEMANQVAARLGYGTCQRCRQGSVIMARGMCSPCYHQDLRARSRMKTKWCQHCRKPFQVSRNDAKWCSKSCRMKAYRLPKPPAPEPKAPAMGEIGAKIGGNAHGPQSTDARNSPAKYSQMTPAELNRFSYDEIQELKRKELCEANDARNAQAPSTQLPQRVIEKIIQQRADMLAQALEGRRRNVFRRPYGPLT